MKKLLLIILYLFSTSSFVFAGAVQAMKQKQAMQEATMQKALIQQRMMQQGAVQQRMMQQGAVQQQIMQQEAIKQQMMEQAHMQGQFPQEIEIEQDFLVQQTWDLPAQGVDDSQIAQIADMSKVLMALESSSKIWPLIADPEPKAFIVAHYINFFREKGAIIKNSPEYYINIIDEMVQASPEMLQNPFELVLQVLAIIEYDFDNGQDKDELAYKVLGSEGFKSNKQRFNTP